MGLEGVSDVCRQDVYGRVGETSFWAWVGDRAGSIRRSKDLDGAEGTAGSREISRDFSFALRCLLEARGTGHFLLVNKKMQAGARARVGATVRIRLEPDLEERPALIPAELEKALKGDRMLRNGSMR